MTSDEPFGRSCPIWFERGEAKALHFCCGSVGSNHTVVAVFAAEPIDYISKTASEYVLAYQAFH
jgi:hypothetical protein